MKCKPHLKCIMGDQKYKDEMGGACGTCDREEKNVYGFCETAEGGRSFAIHWDRQQDNIKIDLEYLEQQSVD